MRKKQYKVIEFPASPTATQIETALNNQLDNGWVLIVVFSVGVKTFGVLESKV